MAKWRVVVLRMARGALLGALLSTTFSLTCRSREYVADSTVLFSLPADAGAPGLLRQVVGSLGQAVPVGGDMPINSYAAVLRSRRVYLAAARATGVQKWLGLPHEDQVVKWMRGAVTVQLQPDQTIVVAARTSGTPSVQSPRDLLDRAQANKRDRGARQMAANLVQSVMGQMAQLEDEFQLDAIKSRVTARRERLAQEEKHLADLVRQLLASQRATLTVDPDATLQALNIQYTAEQKNLLDVQAQLDAQRRRRAELVTQMQRELRGMDRLPSEYPVLSQARERRRLALSAYLKATGTYGQESSQVQAAKLDLRRAQDELAGQVASFRSGMIPELLQVDVEVASLQAAQSFHQRTLRRMEGQLSRMPAALLPVKSLALEVEAQRKSIELVRQQVLEAEGQLLDRGNRWKVLDEANPPRIKSGPSTTLALVAGFFFGAMLMSGPILGYLYNVLFEPADASAEPTA